MEKTIYSCDFCKKDQKSDKDVFRTQKSIDNKQQVIDICFDCIRHILQIYIDCHGVNTLCDFCRGRGQVKDFYHNNEYNWEQCTVCKGTGKLNPNIKKAK